MIRPAWRPRAGRLVAGAGPVVLEWTVFNTGTPALGNETDGPIALSTCWHVNDANTYYVHGVEFYCATSEPADVEVAIWERIDDSTPGAQLAVQASSGPFVTGTRNRVMFGTSVPVSLAAYPGGLYATLGTPTSYVATSGYFTTDSYTNGPITAPVSGTPLYGRNGGFRAGVATADYPNQGFNEGGYWVSPIVRNVA